MSRLTEDWVTFHPSADSASANSSWVRMGRVLISSRILSWRFRRSAVIRLAVWLPCRATGRWPRRSAGAAGCVQWRPAVSLARAWQDRGCPALRWTGGVR